MKTWQLCRSIRLEDTTVLTISHFGLQVSRQVHRKAAAAREKKAVYSTPASSKTMRIQVASEMGGRSKVAT